VKPDFLLRRSIHKISVAIRFPGTDETCWTGGSIQLPQRVHLSTPATVGAQYPAKSILRLPFHLATTAGFNEFIFLRYSWFNKIPNSLTGVAVKSKGALKLFTLGRAKIHRVLAFDVSSNHYQRV